MDSRVFCDRVEMDLAALCSQKQHQGCPGLRAGVRVPGPVVRKRAIWNPSWLGDPPGCPSWRRRAAERGEVGEEAGLERGQKKQ